jgi:type II secretory pathway pseudopilin PulG
VELYVLDTFDREKKLMKNYNLNRKGFTIPEVLTAMLTFVLLFTIIVSSFVLAMRYMTTTEKQVAANNICQGALEMIASELRQGVPNLDPGYGRTPSGYKAIPGIGKTAVLMPNEKNKTSNEIIFTEPNFSKLSSMSLSTFKFEKIYPYSFQRVRYYIGTTGNDKGKLIRQANPIGDKSQLLTGTTSIIAEAEQGEFVLTAKYVSPRSLEVILQIVRKTGAKTEVLAKYSSLVTTVVE